MKKYFVISLIINLIIIYLYGIYIAAPIKAMNKAVTQGVCQMWKIDCKFE